MRKFITLALVVITISVHAQKKEGKDSTLKGDTVYVLSQPEMQFIVSILRGNTLTYNGKPLTFDDVLSLIQNFENKLYVLPKKEQPKK